MGSLLSKQVSRKLCMHYTVTNDAFLPGSGMGTLQQLLDKDNSLFDEMTAHQVYSFIQSVKAFPFFPLRDDGQT